MLIKKTAIILLILISGCTTNPTIRESQNLKSVKEKVEQEQSPKRFFIRQGDTIDRVLSNLGQIDGVTYIYKDKLTMPGQSAEITSVDDLKSYFNAYLYDFSIIGDENGKYKRVSIKKVSPAAFSKSSQACNVKLSGSLPLGITMTDICESANIVCKLGDTGASAFAGVTYPVSFTGKCGDALEYLAKRGDLAITFDDDGAEIKMMDTAIIDIGVPFRDRQIAVDVLAEGSSGGGSSNNTNGQTQNNNTNSSSGGKQVRSSFVTAYTQSIRNLLQANKTQFGTWHYLPETGQIFVRDKAEAVASMKSSIQNLAQGFQSRFNVTLTFYRLTSSSEVDVNSQLSKMFSGGKFALALGAPSIAAAASTLDYTGKTSSAKLSLLSTLGTIETLDSYNVNLQSGVPQTIKVANNTEYVKNVSTVTTGTVGTTTSTIEQSNATDGAFITLQARQTEQDRIAIDYGVYINRVDGFDVTQTQTSTVKSQKGFERTFDSMAIVDDGYPYVVAVISGKNYSKSTSTLPGLEESGMFGVLAGGKLLKTSNNTYIVAIIEANRM